MIYHVCDKPVAIEITELDKVVLFASDYLGTDVDITIEFTILDDIMQCGHCDYEDGEFTITISKLLNKQFIIKTLFHEMVHVKQFHDGRLEGGFNLKWLGKIYHGDYNKSPWETEAYYIEKEMMKEWNK
jgi:hypothetical protein